MFNFLKNIKDTLLKSEEKVYPKLSALSSYDEYAECQVGSTIIFVYHKNLGEEESLKRANEDFDLFWDMCEEVLIEAEKSSRIELPLLWKEHDNNKIKESPLEIWSIHYNAKNRTFSFDVYTNNNYGCGEENAANFPEGELLVTVYYDNKEKKLESF